MKGSGFAGGNRLFGKEESIGNERNRWEWGNVADGRDFKAGGKKRILKHHHAQGGGGKAGRPE